MSKIIDRKVINFDLPEGKKKERIDLFLVNSVENATRTKVQNLIKQGNVTVNGKAVKPNYKVAPFDKIEVIIPVAPRPDKAEPEDIPLDIVYEDEYLLVVNKPAGLVVHPAFGNFTGTLVNALLHHTASLSTMNDPSVRPGIVHRIDKDTSGLLLIAKNDQIHARLARQFSAHKIQREYWAVVWGKFRNKTGTIKSYITRSKKDRKVFTMSDSEGKIAITHYEVIEEFEFASLIRLHLETGRTHQIRVHMSGNGHPIFSDDTYGGRAIRYGDQLPGMKQRAENLFAIMNRQALHAKTLGFYHPGIEKDVLFNSELPEDFRLLIEKLK